MAFLRVCAIITPIAFRFVVPVLEHPNSFKPFHTVQFHPQAMFKLMGCCFVRKTSTKQSFNRQTRTINFIGLAPDGCPGIGELLGGAPRLGPVVIGGLRDVPRRAPGLGSSVQVLGGQQGMSRGRGCCSGMQRLLVLCLYSARTLFPAFLASRRIDIVLGFHFASFKKHDSAILSNNSTTPS